MLVSLIKRSFCREDTSSLDGWAESTGGLFLTGQILQAAGHDPILGLK